MNSKCWSFFISLFVQSLLSLNVHADVLVASGSEIVKLSADGTGASTFASNATFGMFFDSVEQKLYFTGTSDSIRRVNRDGSNPETIISNAGNNVVDVVIDRISTTPKIIWTDLNGFQIRRSNLDGSSIENLVTGISDPHGLLLDVSSSKIYWSDAIGISRSNVDGTSLESTIISDMGGPIRFMTIVNNKIYWTNATDNTVKRANLDGSSQETITSSGASIAQGIAYDSTLGKLFFIGGPSGVGLRSMSLDGSNLTTHGAQTGYDIIVDYSTVASTPTPTHTATPTETSTPTPSPTNTPVLTSTPTPIPGVLPAEVCISEFLSSDLYTPLLGTLTLTKSDNSTFEYTKTGLRMYGINQRSGDIDYRLNLDDGHLYLRSGDSAPLGIYSGKIYTKKDKRRVSVLVNSGACPLATPTPSSSTSISGSLSFGEPSSIGNLEAAGDIYALLYNGATPNDRDATALPAKGILVSADGTFKFTDVVPGEYHIVFLTDAVKFTSSYVSVIAINKDNNIVPAISAQTIKYNDTGCSIKDVSSKVYSATTQVIDMNQIVSDQIGASRILISKNLKKGKQNSIFKSLNSIESKLEKIQRKGVLVTSKLPVKTRATCPTSNKCTKKSLSKLVSSYTSSLDSFKELSSSVSDKIEGAIGKKAAKTNRQFLSKINKAYTKAVKNIKNIPTENYICKES